MAATLAQSSHTPVGSRAFSSEKLRERVAEERQLWHAILHQCAWQTFRAPPSFPAIAHRSTTMASGKPWKPSASKCPVGRGTPVRTRTHHFAHEDGNPLRCRRLAHDRPAKSRGRGNGGEDHSQFSTRPRRFLVETQGGQNSATGRDHPKAPQVSLASGSMAGRTLGVFRF